MSLSNTHVLVAQVVSLFDMQFSQDCYHSGICGEFKPFIDAGKPVFIADDQAFSQSLCNQATASGYTLWFSSPTQDGTINQPCH